MTVCPLFQHIMGSSFLICNIKDLDIPKMWQNFHCKLYMSEIHYSIPPKPVSVVDYIYQPPALSIMLRQEMCQRLWANFFLWEGKALDFGNTDPEMRGIPVHQRSSTKFSLTWGFFYDQSGTSDKNSLMSFHTQWYINIVQANPITTNLVSYEKLQWNAQWYHWYDTFLIFPDFFIENKWDVFLKRISLVTINFN